MPNRNLWNKNVPRVEYDYCARDARLRLERVERLLMRRAGRLGKGRLRVALVIREGGCHAEPKSLEQVRWITYSKNLMKTPGSGDRVVHATKSQYNQSSDITPDSGREEPADELDKGDAGGRSMVDGPAANSKGNRFQLNHRRGGIHPRAYMDATS
jgi:hypothetical protein